MAAIVDEHGKLDLKKLHSDLKKALPPYARPVFIRTLKNLETTGNNNNMLKHTSPLLDILIVFYVFILKNSQYMGIHQFNLDVICFCFL